MIFSLATASDLALVVNHACAISASIVLHCIVQDTWGMTEVGTA